MTWVRNWRFDFEIWVGIHISIYFVLNAIVKTIKNYLTTWIRNQQVLVVQKTLVLALTFGDEVIEEGLNLCTILQVILNPFFHLLLFYVVIQEAASSEIFFCLEPRFILHRSTVILVSVNNTYRINFLNCCKRMSTSQIQSCRLNQVHFCAGRLSLTQRAHRELWKEHLDIAGLPRVIIGLAQVDIYRHINDKQYKKELH